MSVSSISATITSKPVQSTTAAVPFATVPRSTTPSNDSVSISDAAYNAFEKAVKQVRNQINAYEHQVTWRLDHHSPVTGPNGVIESTGTVTTSATGGTQLINKQPSSATVSAITLQVAGSLGPVQLSFAAGTKLSAVVNAITNVKTGTGVSAALSGTDLKFNSTESGAGQFVTVSAGSFNTVVANGAEAVAQTVANGFNSLESLPWPYVQLTTAQYAQVNRDLHQLNAEQTRFQKFVQSRSVADGLTKLPVTG